jgi:hypothetical protein
LRASAESVDISSVRCYDACMAKSKKNKKRKDKPEPRGIIGCSLGDDGKICVTCEQDDRSISFSTEHLDEVIDTLKDFRKFLKTGKT